jgi:hypothetical protein
MRGAGQIPDFASAIKSGRKPLRRHSPGVSRVAGKFAGAGRGGLFFLFDRLANRIEDEEKITRSRDFPERVHLR